MIRRLAVQLRALAAGLEAFEEAYQEAIAEGFPGAVAQPSAESSPSTCSVLSEAANSARQRATEDGPSALALPVDVQGPSALETSRAICLWLEAHRTLRAALRRYSPQEAPAEA